MSDGAKPKRGGRREGAGRPRTFSQDAVRLSVTLERAHVEWLRELGEGNVSAGIRRLLERKRRRAKK